MIRTTATLIATLLALSAAPPATAQPVTVLRGAAAETGKSTTAGGVDILRGTPVAAKPSRTAADRSRRYYYRPFIAAGDTLWLRGARTGRLVGCWVGGTGHVGRFAIRCTSY